MLRGLAVLLSIVCVSCSNDSSNVTGPLESPVAANPTVVIETVTEAEMALLSLEQAFNDLGRYVISARTKNLSYDDDVSGVTVKFVIYTSDDEEIDTEESYVGSIQPRAEYVVEAEIWQFELGGLTPDSTKTTVDILVDGNSVTYQDLREQEEVKPEHTPFHEIYDFRWSNWGDTIDDVLAVDTSGLEFDDENVTGYGRSTRISMFTTFILKISDTVSDTSSVEYEFIDDVLHAGHYWFSDHMTTETANMLLDELNTRYGDPVSQTDERIDWVKNSDTPVYLSMPSDSTNGCLHYQSAEYDILSERADNYNNLPIRPVVPD